MSKTMPKKAKGNSQPDPSGDGLLFEISEIHDTEDVEIKPMRKRPSKYQSVIDQMTKLRAGQSFTVLNQIQPKTGKKADPKVVHNRLNAAIQRSGVQPPKGCRFRKVTLVGDDIWIGCEKEDAPAPARKK